ncbi:hypothetical protein J2X07_000536 [Fictibacillus barbaricus]|uniref:Uncharacterized protein n=1 Tax=Fictibacillus barbaricus TaxID=182136 RepID=A0ABU1TWH4_9BACL|nr:hypothetical protein [Fictibacillus barbaricus]
MQQSKRDRTISERLLEEEGTKRLTSYLKFMVMLMGNFSKL